MNQRGNRPIWRRDLTQFWGRTSLCLVSVLIRSHSKTLQLLSRFAIIAAFVCGPCALRSQAEQTKNLIYHPATSFKIPFDIDPSDKPLLKSIELYVSDDLGSSWKLSTATTPSASAFPFRGGRDGEYWFAVRTLDIQGRYNPSDDKPIIPDWRVIVDTKKPTLALVSASRRGSSATVRWDARDENLDLGSLVLEYAITGTGQWLPIPIGRSTPSGEVSWDAKTAERILIRGTVADKAGNLVSAETEMSDGAASRPDMPRHDSDSMESQAPPPIAQMASTGNRRGILGPNGNFNSSQNSEMEEWVDNPASQNSRAPSGKYDVGSGLNRNSRGENQPTNNQMRDRAIAATEQEDLPGSVPLISTSKFPLNYTIEDAGPNGPATVELWVTKDQGQNWSRWAEDTDRLSPIQVDLGGEGLFGISIVARSLAGQGDEIPRSGSSPQIWVEVDSTAPAMVLNVIKVGVGSQTGKVLVSWRAEDRNFGSRPISLYYRPETANQWMPIAEGIENTGQYVWTPGPQVPPVFHVRVEAKDQAGNESAVDTTNYEPVLLDRSRPRAKIIGLSIAGQNASPQPEPSYKPVIQSQPMKSNSNQDYSQPADTPSPDQNPSTKTAGQPRELSDNSNSLDQVDSGPTQVKKVNEQPKAKLNSDPFPKIDEHPASPKEDTKPTYEENQVRPKKSEIPLSNEILNSQPVPKVNENQSLVESKEEKSPGVEAESNSVEIPPPSVAEDPELPPVTDIPLPSPLSEAPPSLIDNPTSD